LLVSSASGPYSWAGANAKEYCRENIARQEVPDYLSIVEECPAMSGKIWKHKLLEAAVELRPRPPVAPRGGYGFFACRSPSLGGGNFAPGGKDAYVCDLSRGRRTYTSLHPE
jgi:hypothetical protein